MTRRLVIAGNGMAAQRLLEQLSQRGDYGYRIDVISDEPHGGYNRILLSPWLAGDTDSKQLITHPLDWYRQQHINLHRRQRITVLDRARQQLVSTDGSIFPYDTLVLATGSRPRQLLIPGHQLAGVITLRTLDDARQIQQRARTDTRAVVIGGGLLGLETAWGLHCRGMQVTVLHNGDWLMQRQLDSDAGHYLAGAFRQRGIEIITGVRSEAFLGDSHGVRSVALADGRQLPCSLAVISIGIEPNKALAAEAGLDCDRGVLVDRWLRSSDDNIRALGECCQIGDETFGLVEPIYRQAEILARQLTDESGPGYQSMAQPTRLKVSGMQVFSAGHPAAFDDARRLTWRDPKQGHYGSLYLRGERLQAAVLLGDCSAGAECFAHIKNGTAVTDPSQLLLGGAVA